MSYSLTYCIMSDNYAEVNLDLLKEEKAATLANLKLISYIVCYRNISDNNLLQTFRFDGNSSYFNKTNVEYYKVLINQENYNQKYFLFTLFNTKLAKAKLNIEIECKHRITLMGLDIDLFISNESSTLKLYYLNCRFKDFNRISFVTKNYNLKNHFNLLNPYFYGNFSNLFYFYNKLNFLNSTIRLDKCLMLRNLSMLSKFVFCKRYANSYLYLNISCCTSISNNLCENENNCLVKEGMNTFFTFKISYFNLFLTRINRHASKMD